MTTTTQTIESRPQINVGFVVLISGTAALGNFLFGFASAVVNGAVPGIQASFNSTSAQLGFWVVTFTFPSLLNLGPSVAYLIYAVFAGISIYFVMRFVTETKRRTLEQM